MALTLISDEIERYVESHTDTVDPLLDELRDETQRAMEHPQMQLGRVGCTFLRILVRLVRAKRILEVGMFTGYSALMMAEGLPDDGELIACEIDPKAEEIARRFFARSPHGKKIRIEMGSALRTIRKLKGPFDLVFIDADKLNYGRYFEAVLPLLPSNGIIIADNALWGGAVVDPKNESGEALAAFNAKVAKDERVEKVLLTIRDGMMLIRKK